MKEKKDEIKKVVQNEVSKLGEIFIVVNFDIEYTKVSEE